MHSSILFTCNLLLLFSVTAADWSSDQDPEKWNQAARNAIDSLLNKKLNKNIAKNLIMFLGDGMGVSTVTAGRIRKGQRKGMSGEELVTNMESLPHIALSKTYNINAQTPDSAGTGTAYLSGVKTRAGIIGLNGYAKTKDCKSSLNTQVDTILKWAHQAGKSVGIVTTTRITHASPAASYANSAWRHWETFDGEKFKTKQHEQGCKDIAAQLIDNNSFINVILGGGRKNFFPNTSFDYKRNKTGLRIDNRNLINDWTDNMSSTNKRFKFIWNASDFRNTNFKNYDHILGLLAYDHMEYSTFANRTDESSLEEMTEKAIQLLSQNEKGYFLFVEGGRIDHGHHDNRAILALDEYVSFDDAIGKGLNLTSDEDTMIVVTADHSHAFTIGGDSVRGNPVLGLATNWKNLSDSNLTYTSILYGNGPGGLLNIRTTNLTQSDTESPYYKQEAVVFNKIAAHGGEDVPVYATGPMSFLFSNTIEQSFIPHFMAYSACIGPYKSFACEASRKKN